MPLVVRMVNIVTTRIAAPIRAPPHALVADAFVPKRAAATRAIESLAPLPLHESVCMGHICMGHKQRERGCKGQQGHSEPDRHEPGQQQACLPLLQHCHRQ